MKKPIDALLETVDWQPVEPPDDNPDNLPYPTHQGMLWIGGCALHCLVLNTGQRIFTTESIERFFGCGNLT
jgi:hypothetical protein